MRVETFIDYSEILKIVLEITEESITYDYVCTEEDKRLGEHLGENIEKNLKGVSSLEQTDNPDIVKLSINDTIIINISKTTGQIESVNKLTAFETRALAQGKTEGIPFSREGKPDFTPKTDLHTHYAGALRTESLIKIGKEHNIPYPTGWLENMGIDVSKYEIDDEGKIKVSEMADEDIKILEEHLRMPIATQETFMRMEEVYSLRKPFTKNKELFPEFLRELAYDYKQKGVEYAELSMSNFMTEPEYMQMVEDCLPEIEQETGVKIRFLAAISRLEVKELNQDEVDRMKVIAKSPYIVGMDVLGYELNSTNDFAKELQQIARYAMEEDPEFSIRVHAGENPIFQDNVRDALEIIYREHEKLEEETGRKLPMPKVRIGHGLYGVTDEVLTLAKEMGAIIEFNMSSNLALNNIESISQIPIKEYMDNGVQVVLGTDGHGMYSTTSRQEVILAMAAGLDERDFEKIKETEEAVIENARVREEKHHRIIDIPSLYSEVTYSTEDGTPHYTDEVAQMYKAEKKEALASLKDKVTSMGIESDEQQISDATDGKIPIVITGASENNWPNISKEDQHEIAVMMQVLANTLNPEKAFIVTGGTNFGVEKTMHEAVHRRNQNNNDELVLLGTLTMEATHNNLEGIEENTITHATILESNGKVAKNWQQLPDTQLEYARKRNGSVIAIGGGAVVSNVIQRAHNLGDVDLHLMDGPKGASTDESRSLAGNGYSFKTIEELLQRLYTKNPNMFVKDFSLDEIEEYIMQAKLEVDLSPERMAELSEHISDFYHVVRDKHTQGKDDNEIGDGE